MVFEFNTTTPLEEMKNALGTMWDNDTIDSRRGAIYCENVVFMWLSD